MLTFDPPRTLAAGPINGRPIAEREFVDVDNVPGVIGFDSIDQ
jgi:hypothetical protein